MRGWQEEAIRERTHPGYFERHRFRAGPDRFAYTFDGYADFLKRFATVMNLTRYALYLHDYGSQLGLRLAIKAPESDEGFRDELRGASPGACRRHFPWHSTCHSPLHRAAVRPLAG
jgi:pimeloyl-ACP methyl ester carboxylesterase